MLTQNETKLDIYIIPYALRVSPRGSSDQAIDEINVRTTRSLVLNSSAQPTPHFRSYPVRRPCGLLPTALPPQQKGDVSFYWMALISRRISVWVGM